MSSSTSPSTTGAAQPPAAHLQTSDGRFLLPSSSGSPPTTLCLRGVNLSSTTKFPTVGTRPGSISDSLSGATGEEGERRTQPGQLNREQRDRARHIRAGQQSHLGEESVRFFSEAEEGGREGWFVGHPFAVEEADTHLKRLKAWGFNVIRYIIPWEALEHAGPGKYDEEFIDYTISILRKCREHGFRVYISPHQDAFSRFISGSGAPYWALVAVGLNPRRINQTGSAALHQCYATEGFGGVEGKRAAEEGRLTDWPDMIWNTNLHRLAARHCFTMFFASEDFARKCTIDGLPASRWLQNHYNEAYGHLADRLRDAGDILDTCVIGWDSMNEPSEGFIGIPDLNEFPESQSFKKGPSPTPAQGFLLGVGRSVDDIEYGDFTTTGQKKTGTVTLTPPEGKGVWLTRSEANDAQERWGWDWGKEWDFWDENGEGGCPWAGHGVWDVASGNILENTYFRKAGKEPADFIDDYWKHHYISYITRIRESHPGAISFVNPPIFESPPDLGEDVKQGRMALSSHFYDGLTMLDKRRHMFNADTVGLQRGLKNMVSALKFGSNSIRSTLRDQLSELKSDAYKSDGIAEEEDGGDYPTIIGELGTPFDMKKTKLFGLAKGKTDRQDYREPAKAMDQLLNACDGRNALSYTLWVYEPFNTHANGDGWNGEDLSLLSFDEVYDDDDLLIDSPPDLHSLIRVGTRGIESWCRPYPVESTGKVLTFSFDMSGEFELVVRVEGIEGLEAGPLWKSQEGGSQDKDKDRREVQGVLAADDSSTFTSTEAKADSKAAVAESTEVTGQGSTKIYLPYVHYLSDPTSSTEKKIKGKHVIGEPDPAPGQDGEWKAGRGAARIEFDLLELSEGSLEVEGQWGTWVYPLYARGRRELRIKLRRAE